MMRHAFLPNLRAKEEERAMEMRREHDDSTTISPRERERLIARYAISRAQ